MFGLGFLMWFESWCILHNVYSQLPWSLHLWILIESLWYERLHKHTCQCYSIFTILVKDFQIVNGPANFYNNILSHLPA